MKLNSHEEYNYISHFFSVLQVSYGQVETKFFPKGDAFNQVRIIKEHPKANKVTKLPSFNVQKLVDEDRLNENMDRPYRFGIGFDTGITLVDEAWDTLDTGRIWSMEFKSIDAYSINFVFDQFFLSENAKLYITNVNGTMLYGPVSSKQNTRNGFYLTDLIQGDDVTIYLYEPNSEKGKSRFRIKRVVHAYKSLFSNMAYGSLGASESCNNDINCFPDWDDESDAVALVLLSNGTEWCSGSILMTANQSFTPYFLSAFHCIDSSIPYGSLSATEISNAENWMFKFQYKRTTCGGSTATTGITYNGAQFRAAWNVSDFSLMEMNNSPIENTQFSWLGWDRSGNTPTSGTAIHHPAGDVMKISFDVNQFQISSWGGTNNHWLLAFDDGVVQKGSSGSPILDQNNRVVGQLHGNQNYNPGLSFCAQSRAEYGRFNNSWTGGGTATTRLSNWLDPCGSGVLTTNSSRAPYISGPSIVCFSGTTYTLKYPPPVNSILWECGPGLTITSGQNTDSCKFTATTNGTSWIRATLVTSCGSFTLPQRTVNTGSLPTPVILGNHTVKCGGTGLTYKLDASNTTGGETFLWDSNIVMITEGETAPECKITMEPPSGNGYIYCTVTACGVSKTGSFFIGLICESELSLLISPNPSASETMIELVSGKDKTPVEDMEWSINVYDQSQNIQVEGTKYKAGKRTISTVGWKDGIYIVRAIVGEDIISEKLVVKH